MQNAPTGWTKRLPDNAKRRAARLRIGHRLDQLLAQRKDVITALPADGRFAGHATPSAAAAR